MMSNARNLLDRLAVARVGWMTGQLDRVQVEGLDSVEANLQLLAMDGQFRALLAAPQQRDDLKLAPPLPEPSNAYPSDTARAQFRQVFDGRQQDGKLQVLTLLDRRGYQAHPFDFTPETQWDGLPSAYEPQLAWLRSIRGTAEAATESPYSRQGTQSQYQKLRAVEPANAENWLRGEFAAKNAAQRQRLLQDVSHLLDARNIGLLGELSTSDRSPKVVTLANQLLRRFGVMTGNPDMGPDMGPLDYIERSKSGLLRRKLVLTAPAQMNPTRRNLLVACLGQLGLQQMAAHFGLDEAALLAAWDWKDSHADISRALMLCALTTGSDAACLSVWQNHDIGPDLRQGLEPQHLAYLPENALTDYATAMLQGLPKDQLGAISAILHHLRRLGLDHLNPSQSALLWKIGARHPDLNPTEADKPNQDQRLRDAVFALSMVLVPSDAAAALTALTARGIHAADPLLAPLQLSLSLSPIVNVKETA